MNRNMGRGAVRGKVGANRGNMQGKSGAISMRGAYNNVMNLIGEYTDLETPDNNDIEALYLKVMSAYRNNDLKLIETSYANFHHKEMPQIINRPCTNTLLHQSAKKGDKRGLELFLKIGGNPNIWNKSNRTPLHKAYNSEVITRILIKFGANVNTQDKLGQTPLHKACIHGNFDVAKELVIAGANMNIQDFNEKVPLDFSDFGEELRAELYRIYMWKKSKLALFTYKFSRLSKIPEGVYRQMLTFL